MVAGWVLATAACTGDPIPLSAQAGSTIVLPFSDADDAVLEPIAQVAYGGTEYADPQRGSLVVQLDQAGGFELTTRLAFLAEAPVESPMGPGGLYGALDFGRNLLLVVDIPTDAPLGTHSLHVVHRRTTGGVVVDVPVDDSPGSLAILPNAVQAGAETIYGSPTPTQAWVNGTLYPIDLADLATVIPDPSFGVAVTTPSGTPPEGDSRYVSYAAVEVSYPSDVIDIVRVVASEPTESLVWHRDDLQGTLRIFSLVRSKKGAPTGLGPVRVVFALDDPEGDVLDLADVTALLQEADDQSGIDLVQDWSLAASLTAIR
jgi:hypothetical protein